MHYKELCGKSFLSSDDLEEGKVYPLVIEQALREDAFDPKTRKPKPVGMLAFNDYERGQLVNCNGVIRQRNRSMDWQDS